MPGLNNNAAAAERLVESYTFTLQICFWEVLIRVFYPIIYKPSSKICAAPLTLHALFFFALGAFQMPLRLLADCPFKDRITM